MTLLRIAQLGEPVLRQRARELTLDELLSPEIQQLIDDMVETMRDADGAGIAAPQVYQSVRLCVMELADNPRYPGHPPTPLTVLVNPVVEPLVGEAPHQLGDHEAIEMYEGCLSVHGLRGRVRRPRRVRFTALDREGKPFGGELEGIGAAVIQHETDHLDGVLFVDRADPRTLCFLREFGRYVPPRERFRDLGASS
ncbi:MAG: peptide deformylase [Polyangiaceae bacterium]|nr:peptide deformylase [Polyangiaceae bacterium]MCW5789539.1 peptide deformylase [Polyangiaceae bacterium]